MRSSCLVIVATVAVATASLAAFALAPRANAPSGRGARRGRDPAARLVRLPAARRLRIRRQDDRRAGARDASRRAARRDGRAGQPGRIRALRRRRRLPEAQGRRSGGGRPAGRRRELARRDRLRRILCARDRRGLAPADRRRNGLTPRPNASAASRRPPRAATTSPAAGSPSSTPNSALARQPKAPQPFGHFGLNTHGVADLAGNVWEWTNSCYERRAVEPNGDARLLTRNCRVRALEGEHRTFMSDFIRDGADRRLLGRPAADQSRLPPGALARQRRRAGHQRRRRAVRGALRRRVERTALALKRAVSPFHRASRGPPATRFEGEDDRSAIIP